MIIIGIILLYICNAIAIDDLFTEKVTFTPLEKNDRIYSHFEFKITSFKEDARHFNLFPKSLG